MDKGFGKIKRRRKKYGEEEEKYTKYRLKGEQSPGSAGRILVPSQYQGLPTRVVTMGSSTVDLLGFKTAGDTRGGSVITGYKKAAKSSRVFQVRGR